MKMFEFWNDFHWNVHCDCVSCICFDRFKTLRPRQNGRHFADDIFKCISLNENVSIAIKFSLKFVPKAPINNIPALVQITAWRRPSDKPLSEPMMVSLPTHICVTRPQWFNIDWFISLAQNTGGKLLSVTTVCKFPDMNHQTLAGPCHDDVIKWKHFPRYWPFVRAPATSGFPPQRPVTRSFDVCLDLHRNKRFIKHLRRWWFKTPWHSLWRHCNVFISSIGHKYIQSPLFGV